MKDKRKEFKERYYDKLFPGGGDDYDFMWGDFIKILTQAREDERKKILGGDYKVGYKINILRTDKRPTTWKRIK